MSPAELCMKRDELNERIEELRKALAERADQAQEDSITQEARDTQLRENIELLENRIADIEKKLSSLDDQDRTANGNG